MSQSSTPRPVTPASVRALRTGLVARGTREQPVAFEAATFEQFVAANLSALPPEEQAAALAYFAALLPQLDRAQA